MLDDFADGLHGVFGAGRVDLQVLDGSADLVDVVSRLVENIIEFLAESDDGVGQCTGGFLVGVDVELELARDAIEFLKDSLLVVLHAGRFVEEPDDGELVFLEMAKDFAGELVERDANFLDIEESDRRRFCRRRPDRRPAAAGRRLRGEPPSPSILTPGRLVPSLMRPLPTPRTLGVLMADRCPLHPSTIAPPLSITPPSPANTSDGSPAYVAYLVANGFIAANVIRVGIDRERLGLAVTEPRQGRVEIDDLGDGIFCENVAAARAERMTTWTSNETVQALHEISQSDPAAAPGTELGYRRGRGGTVGLLAAVGFGLRLNHARVGRSRLILASAAGGLCAPAVAVFQQELRLVATVPGRPDHDWLEPPSFR